MAKEKRSSPWSPAQARRTLAELAASGLTVREFARHHGIDDGRLHRWRRLLADRGKQPRTPRAPTTPAVIELKPPARHAHVEVVLASGIVLRVPPSIEPTALASLVSAVREC